MELNARKCAKYLLILALIAIILHSINFLNCVHFVILTSAFISAAAWLAFKVHYNQLNEIHFVSCSQFSSLREFSLMPPLNDVNADEVEENYFKSRTLISKNVDEVMEEIIDLCLRDFVMIWYKTLVTRRDTKRLEIKLKNELWQILGHILVRLQNMDAVRFVTANIVNRCQKHLQKISACWSLKDTQKDTHSYYSLSAHLASDEKEIEFLRKLNDFLMSLLLPRSYLEGKPFRHLLNEILSVPVLQKCIDFVCDADYLNQKLLDYIKWHRIQMDRHRRTYAYAETYEEFIRIINQCCDIQDLKRMRFQIVTEIMQATVINNLKRERGIDLDKEMFSGPISSAKGDLLQARNLKRYINQLSFAKSQCEKRINVLNGATIGFTSYLSRSTSSETLPQPKRKTVLAFKIIMYSDLCRCFLKKFMQHSLLSSSSTAEARKHIIVLWESIQELSKQETCKQYQIANEILNHPHFIVTVNNLIKLPKIILKGMEEFIIGNKGPESFYSAQSIIYDVLEHRYYPLFIVSKEYDEMLIQFQDTLEQIPVEFEHQEENYNFSLAKSTNPSNDECDNTRSHLLNTESVVETHASLAKTKLESLQQKLKDKRHALQAVIRSEHQRDKLLSHNINVNAKLIQLLEKEIDEITREYNQLECHLEWTRTWLNGMGKWVTQVHNIELSPESIDSRYLVILIVHRSDMIENCSNGWVITRTQDQIVDFRKQLIKKFAVIKKYELPKCKTITKANKPQKQQETKLKAMKHQFQCFFDAVTANESISKSEELYLFLSQSMETLRQPLAIQMQQASKSRSSRLPFANLFGITSTHKQPAESISSDDETQSERQFLILDDLENKDNCKDDNIAEPLYNLISEVFELRGVFNWLRRTLVTFVQVTYGQTINKQLRMTVEWICSESMIHYYLTSFRDSMWPDGKLADPWPQRSDEDKKRTQILAKQHLLNSIPELITNLLGHQNAKKGFMKVFDALQDKQLNKQLFYELMETFMFEFAPELKNT